MAGESDKNWWQQGLIVFAEVTGWIALPIIVSLYLGKYLDAKYHREPWFFLGLTGLAFVVSCVGIVVVARKYLKQIATIGKVKNGEEQKKIEGIKK